MAQIAVIALDSYRALGLLQSFVIESINPHVDRNTHNRDAHQRKRDAIRNRKEVGHYVVLKVRVGIEIHDLGDQPECKQTGGE